MYPNTALEWLEKLITFDTTSRNSNMEMIRYMEEYLDSHGVTSVLSYDAAKTKANLFATLPGQGGNKQGGIILSGHTDVVPCDGQKWDTDPFKPVVKDGRLYGRGACDMKGFIAVCMSLTPELLKMPRKKPVHFAWSYDEEVGCLGGRVLTELIKRMNVRAEGCVVGEPTSNKMVVAHKGFSLWNVQVRGKAVHSSYALTSSGCNAIDYAAKLIVRIREIAEDIKKNESQDLFFDVPFTTVSTNLIRGGNAVNTVPATCDVVYEFRNLPDVTQESIQMRIEKYVKEELLPQIRSEFADASITLKNAALVPHMPNASESDPFVMLVRQLTGTQETHKLGCGTEAGQFAQIGVPVVVCGPGDIIVAHQPNEFVPIRDLEASVQIVRSLIAKNQSMKSHM